MNEREALERIVTNEIIVNKAKGGHQICDMQYNYKNEIAIIEEVFDNYDELKRDWEEMSKQHGLLNYFRALCDKQQKVLDILRKSPFILEVLFAQNVDEEFTKKYMWGTITDEEREIVEKWIVK